MSTATYLGLIALACLANIGTFLAWCAMRVAARADHEAEAMARQYYQEYLEEISRRDIEIILTNVEAGAK